MGQVDTIIGIIRKNERHIYLADYIISDGDLLIIENELLNSKINREFSLSKNTITEKGAEIIARMINENPKLKAIGLGRSCSNKIVKLIAKSLEYNATLRSLTIGGADFGDKELIEIAEMIGRNSSLNTLVIFGNNFSDDGIKIFSYHLSRNNRLQELYIYTTSDIERSTKEPLNITDEGAEALAAAIKNKSIVSLLIGWNRMGDKGLNALARVAAENGTLAIFRVDGTHITSNGLHSAVNLLEMTTSLSDKSNIIYPSASEIMRRVSEISDRNMEAASVLFNACKERDYPTIQALLQKGTCPYCGYLSLGNNNSLAEAITMNDSKIVKLLLSTRFKSVLLNMRMNYDYETPIELAQRLGYQEIVDILQAAEINNSSTPSAPVSTLVTNSAPSPTPLSAEELRQLQQVFTAPIVDSSNAPLYASQYFTANNPSVVTLSPEEQIRLTSMLRHYEYSQIFEGYLTQINQDPVLVSYFRGIQLYLDNTVGALKVIASGYVEGTNITKQLIKLTEQAANSLLSLAGAPMGAGMVVSVLALVLGTVNEHNIQTLAHRVAHLFPNSSENGAILEALALLLTINQISLIQNPPELTTINPIYRTYLMAMAKFHGRDTFTSMDYLVMQQTETIVKFWNTLSGKVAPSIEQWLPQLLAQFTILLPSAINPNQIGKVIAPAASTFPIQHAIMTTPAATTSSPQHPAQPVADKATVEALQLEVSKLRQEMHKLRPSTSAPDSSLEVDAGNGQAQMFARKPPEIDTHASQQSARHDAQIDDMSREFSILQEELAALRSEVQRLRDIRRPSRPPQNETCVIL